MTLRAEPKTGERARAGKAVVSGEFSKKADHGKWFGAKAKNHQQKEYHDPPEAER
jgi:hypothetical protein